MCVFAPLLLNILFAAAINVAYTRFKPDKYTMDALVHPRENKGAGRRGKSITLELALATLLRGVFYTGNAGVISQSPKKLRKVMRGIVVVCTSFGLTISDEAETENICLRTKEMAEPIAMFNIEAAGQVHSQTNDFVYLGEDINHNAHEADPFGGVCGAHESYETAKNA